MLFLFLGLLIGFCFFSFVRRRIVLFNLSPVLLECLSRNDRYVRKHCLNFGISVLVLFVKNGYMLSGQAQLALLEFLSLLAVLDFWR